MGWYQDYQNFRSGYRRWRRGNRAAAARWFYQRKREHDYWSKRLFSRRGRYGRYIAGGRGGRYS